MPRTPIPVTVAVKSGVAVPAATVGDPANNHTFSNDGDTVLLVKNTGTTAAHTVTIHLSRTVDGFAVTPRTVSIPQGASLLLGPYETADYGGKVLVDVDSAELSLTAFSA